MDTSKVTRFEVIDHRPIKNERGEEEIAGRVVVNYGVKVELSLQDDGRTLKVFVNKGEPFVQDMTEWNKSMEAIREVPFIAIGNNEPIPENLPEEVKAVLRKSRGESDLQK